jgi:hypothetical protein
LLLLLLVVVVVVLLFLLEANTEEEVFVSNFQSVYNYTCLGSFLYTLTNSFHTFSFHFLTVAHVTNSDILKSYFND